tara:strand:+ start:1231 stop:1974 length:744 start_codon:yes stop_codon:yes gene_type:complete
MKKSTLKEAIKSKIKSLILEDLMTTDEAFRVLRDMQNIYVDKRKKDLMGRAIDALQAAEVSRMMDRERGLNESLNPEVSRDVNRYIARTAKRYGYSEQDAVYAIMAALKQRNYDGLNESLNPEVGKELDEFLAIINKKYEYDYPHALDAIMAALEQQNIDTKYDMPGFGDTMDALDDISIREEEEPTSAELKKKDSIAATSNKLQKLTKKMKDKAKEFKAAEGDAKDKIKDELKKMTKEKKQLEKAL